LSVLWYTDSDCPFWYLQTLLHSSLFNSASCLANFKRFRGCPRFYINNLICNIF
jgi:hypothetical protein